MWLFWLIKCMGLWSHKTKLNTFIMLIESSLIFNALGWGLKTWITSFWFSRIMMFILNALEVKLKTCKIFYHHMKLCLKNTRTWLWRRNYLKMIMMIFKSYQKSYLKMIKMRFKSYQRSYECKVGCSYCRIYIVPMMKTKGSWMWYLTRVSLRFLCYCWWLFYHYFQVIHCCN